MSESCSVIRKVVTSAHESVEVQELFMVSWVPNTQSNYIACLKNGLVFVKKQHARSLYAHKDTMSIVPHHNEDQKYGVSTVAKSCLSTILTKSEG